MAKKARKGRQSTLSRTWLSLEHGRERVITVRASWSTVTMGTGQLLIFLEFSWDCSPLISLSFIIEADTLDVLKREAHYPYPEWSAESGG